MWDANCRTRCHRADSRARLCFERVLNGLLDCFIWLQVNKEKPAFKFLSDGALSTTPEECPSAGATEDRLLCLLRTLGRTQIVGTLIRDAPYPRAGRIDICLAMSVQTIVIFRAICHVFSSKPWQARRAYNRQNLLKQVHWVLPNVACCPWTAESSQLSCDGLFDRVLPSSTQFCLERLSKLLTQSPTGKCTCHSVQ
jgi:hypothetical protein